MKLFILIAITLLSYSCLAKSLEAEPSFVVIGSTNIHSLNDKQIQRLFSLRQQLSPGNQPVTLARMPLSCDLTKGFSKRLFRLYPYQLQRIWDRQVYSGKAKAPVAVNSEEEMLRYVATEPNALGYISHSTVIPPEFEGKINVIAVY